MSGFVQYRCDICQHVAERTNQEGALTDAELNQYEVCPACLARFLDLRTPAVPAGQFSAVLEASRRAAA